MERRNLLKLLVKGGGAVITAILAIPAVMFGLSPALKPRRQSVWRSLGRLDDFPLGAVHHAVVQPDAEEWRSKLPKGVYVWRREEGEVIVFSRSCTDLGCPVKHDPGSGWFFCPCHGGIFDEQGERRAGPPRRPLDRYAARVTNDGVLEIDMASVPPMV